MKKTLLFTATVLMLFSCQNETTDVTDSTAITTGRRMCAAQDVLEEQMEADPTLAIRMNEIEAFTQKAISSSNFRLSSTGKIIIPVVVNVLYRTTAENISHAQIQSQIDALNKDFTATNSDFSSVPAEFSTVAAGPAVNGIDITFVLDQSVGNVGDEGVIRKSTTKTSWGTRDAMKKSKQGGINPTSPSNTLNLWACKIGGGILGYAQFPGGSLATDGVVIDIQCFGTIGSLYADYNLGRTASHEVGHWMNLRHIWGDASCGDDLVADTPTAKTANYTAGYPYPSTCAPVGHNEMTMNYMDYSNDNLMYMFTLGQKSRMSALFVAGGTRAGFRN